MLAIDTRITQGLNEIGSQYAVYGVPPTEELFYEFLQDWVLALEDLYQMGERGAPRAEARKWAHSWACLLKHSYYTYEREALAGFRRILLQAYLLGLRARKAKGAT